MKNKIVIFLLALLVLPEMAFSQCCSAGNPAGGDGTHAYMARNQAKILFSFEQSYSNQYYSGSAPIDMEELENSSYRFLNLSVNYALLERLMVQADFGYFIDKIQNLQINESDIRFRTRGFGDLNLQARYLLYQTTFPQRRWTVGAGIRLPVGAFHESDQGIQIPVSLQPSSGATKFQLSTFYFYKPSRQQLSWFAYLFYEHSNTIREGYLIHQYGDYGLLSLGMNYHFKERWDISGRIKTEVRGKDVRDETMEIAASGSWLVMAMPAVSYQINDSWSLTGSVDIPVYKYVQGMQLTKFGAFQLSVSKKFN